MNLNKVMIIGRLTQAPESRSTSNGQAVTSFSVATNLVWSNQAGERKEKTEFHNVVCWRKLAEITGKYLIKGQEVYVEGRLQTRSWEGQDGVKRYRTEIVADKVEMGSKPGQGGARKGTSASAPTDSTAPKPQAVPAAPDTSGDVADKEEEINIEDIPF